MRNERSLSSRCPHRKTVEIEAALGGKGKEDKPGAKMTGNVRIQAEDAVESKRARFVLFGLTRMKNQQRDSYPRARRKARNIVSVLSQSSCPGKVGSAMTSERQNKMALRPSSSLCLPQVVCSSQGWQEQLTHLHKSVCVGGGGGETSLLDSRPQKYGVTLLDSRLRFS